MCLEKSDCRCYLAATANREVSNRRTPGPSRGTREAPGIWNWAVQWQTTRHGHCVPQSSVQRLNSFHCCIIPCWVELRIFCHLCVLPHKSFQSLLLRKPPRLDQQTRVACFLLHTKTQKCTKVEAWNWSHEGFQCMYLVILCLKFWALSLVSKRYCNASCNSPSYIAPQIGCKWQSALPPGCYIRSINGFC